MIFTDHKETPASPDLRNISLDPTKSNSLLLIVNPSPHGVHNRLWLLEDLLLHEAGEVPLHDLLNLHLEGGNLPGGVPLPVDPVDAEHPLLTGSNVVVL